MPMQKIENPYPAQCTISIIHQSHERAANKRLSRYPLPKRSISRPQQQPNTPWLQRLLSINIQTTSPEPTHYIDNKSAIQIAENQAPTRHRKFIDIRHYYLQHHLKNGKFTLQHILTGAMRTNKLTKPLQRQNFTTL